MKATGIVRRVDELGRVVLPAELRRTMDMKVGDPVEVYLEDDQFVLVKYKPTCEFCDSDDVVEYKEHFICNKCIDELKERCNSGK